MNLISIEHLTLQRYPITKDPSLRAWNAADEYLISHISEEILSNKNDIKNILICNDQFGALTCALSKLSPEFWTDSFLSKSAILSNLEANKLTNNKIKHLTSNQSIEDFVTYALVLIRIPKHNSLLEYQLTSIAPHINSKTTIIASGMTRDIHNSTLSIFEKTIGDTKTSLAKKKARLIFSKCENNSKNISAENFEKQAKTYTEEKFGVTSYGLAGVFSRDRLDSGSRVLLNYLPQTRANQKVADLGCGTGILGTTLAKINSSLQVVFCDESYLALASAKLTYDNNIDSSRERNISKAEYVITDVLDGVDNNQFDHILCNPPFHQQNVQTLSIANKMFRQSSSRLRESGEFRVVANRHLKYRPMLSQYFKSVTSISDDPKFIVWLAKNPLN